MEEPLYEIERWRERWYYKFGAFYTGPFTERGQAETAADTEVAPLARRDPVWMRETLAGVGDTRLPGAMD